MSLSPLPTWLTPTECGRPRLCLLLTRTLMREGACALELVERCADAGLDAVQIREKDAGAAEVLSLVHALRQRLGDRDVALLINDRVDFALAAGADGVHLGQEDFPPRDARRFVGERNFVIGLSTHDHAQAEAAAEDPAVDYIGIGPLFPTATKGYTAGIGHELASRMQRAAAKPAFWIGGIDPERARALRGAFGFAVSSVVLRDPDPAAVIRALIAAVHQTT